MLYTHGLFNSHCFKGINGFTLYHSTVSTSWNNNRSVITASTGDCNIFFFFSDISVNEESFTGTSPGFGYRLPGKHCLQCDTHLLSFLQSHSSSPPSPEHPPLFNFFFFCCCCCRCCKYCIMHFDIIDMF